MIHAKRWPWRPSDRRRGQLYAIAAALAWSAVGILQRQATVNTETQVVGRAAFAFILLGAYVLSAQRQHLKRSLARPGIWIVALCTAVASSSFIIALNRTTVAQVLFFLAVSPIAAALLGRWLLGERVNRRTWAAIAFAGAGVVLMADGAAGADVGDVLAVFTAMAFAVMIVASRRYREVSLATAICIAQLIAMIAFAPFASIENINIQNLAWLILLGAQLSLGTLFFAVAARLLPAAELAVIILLEAILGPLWAWLGVSERPGAVTLVGGLVVVVAVVIQASGQDSAQTIPAAEESPIISEGSGNADLIASQSDHPPSRQ